MVPGLADEEGSQLGDDTPCQELRFWRCVPIRMGGAPRCMSYAASVAARELGRGVVEDGAGSRRHHAGRLAPHERCPAVAGPTGERERYGVVGLDTQPRVTVIVRAPMRRRPPDGQQIRVPVTGLRSLT
jgi:hypothetical protein